mmetsp:Transcript_43869/g.138503  ORF Transcript_43869/g.138503 Transcript_43869/m.138503 type:complete len:85 (+) Transcript_43869:673-927(+)
MRSSFVMQTPVKAEKDMNNHKNLPYENENTIKQLQHDLHTISQNDISRDTSLTVSLTSLSHQTFIHPSTVEEEKLNTRTSNLKE